MRISTWRPVEKSSSETNRRERFVYARLERTASGQVGATRNRPPLTTDDSDDAVGSRKRLRRALLIAGVVILSVLVPAMASAQGALEQYNPLSRDNLSVSLKMLSILTILTLAPSILLLTTAFPRIVIVLGFVRRALSTQEVPPNQVIVGLSLILTFFVMGPTFNSIKNEALVPYLNGMPDGEALEIGLSHLRDFMWRQTDPESVDVMISLSMEEVTDDTELTLDQVPIFTLIPAFMLSELKRAFEMGFMIYLPFVVIDLVVASTLISMGMLVLPPVLISLPFKVLIFVLVDGWELIVSQLVASF